MKTKKTMALAAPFALSLSLIGCAESSSAPTDDSASDADALDGTWTLCAPEGGVCAFDGTHDVLYGATTSGGFVVKSETGGVACNNATFGDPAFGTPKHCWVDLYSAPSSRWTACATEGQSCAFSGSHRVLYGASLTSGNVTAVRTGPTPCTNANFGDPAYGTTKHCWVDLGDTPQPPPTYASIQMFGLADGNIEVEAGQDLVLTVRFYAANTLPDPSKVFTHLDGFGSDTAVADALNHFEWVPTGPYPGYGEPYSTTWSGYVEYDYLVNVPETTPPGTYRIGSGIAEGVPPYVGRMDQVTCNGVPRLDLGVAPQVQTCHVGVLTVTPQVHPRSTATDGPRNMYTLVGRSWSP